MVNKNNPSLRSKLGKVKGLGSSGTGTSVWWAQRVTALALLPLSMWFVYLVFRILSGSNAQLYFLAASPFNTILIMLFISVSLYHGTLGMKEIIEDYVHCRIIKVSSIIALNFFSIFTGLIGLCAILVLHFSIFK